MKGNRIDFLILFILCLVTGIFSFYFVDFSIHPIEDAAMLMRYAGHLANGHGIVWNIGEAPIDGATDFLFLITLASFHYLGMSLEMGVRLICISAHFSTLIIIYVGMRRIQQAGILPSFLSSLYFAFGPGLYLAAAYFGSPFFALLTAITWLLAQHCLQSKNESIASLLYFSLSALLLGLCRPEGVLVSVFMLMGISLLLPLKKVAQLFLVFSSVFLVLGGAYFLWRWNYFGYPLPNPFYKKGGGFLYLNSLRGSFENGKFLLLPVFPAFILAFRNKESIRKGFAFAIPIIGSICMWVLLSDEMNFGFRFQYPVLVIGLLSWYPLIDGAFTHLNRLKNIPYFSFLKIGGYLFLAVVYAFLFRRFWIQSTGLTYAKDGRYEAAFILNRFSEQGYTLASTEAGLLPLYSKWRAIDTWGLNDSWIAHHGGLISEEYLTAQKPDVILMHCGFADFQPADQYSDSSLWGKQVKVLIQYARKYHFTLAAAFGLSKESTGHFYFVRPDLQDHDSIVNQIRELEYHWTEKGKIARDFHAEIQL